MESEKNKMNFNGDPSNSYSDLFFNSCNLQFVEVICQKECVKT